MEISEHTAICFCPLYGILHTISKKWALLIIVVSGNAGSVGFNELKRELCNVSSKKLSVTLKELEDKEPVERKVLDTYPPTVRYNLTA